MKKRTMKTVTKLTMIFIPNLDCKTGQELQIGSNNRS